MGTTIEERLAEQLDQKETKIRELKDELDGLRGLMEMEAAFMPGNWPEPVDSPAIPENRLELVFIPSEGFGWRNYLVGYRLVYRHFLGHLAWAALSWTRCDSGYGSGEPDEDRLPRRDGRHIHHDSESLNLPAYRVTHRTAGDFICKLNWKQEETEEMMRHSGANLSRRQSNTEKP